MQDSAGNWTYPVQDGLGSVRGVASDTLAVNGMQHYAPYGDPFGAQGSLGMPFGFTGEQTDGNGQVFLRARYYNPSIGVFPSLDPFEGVMQRPMSLNGYSWVEGNVVNMTDPSGACLPAFDVLNACGCQLSDGLIPYILCLLSCGLKEGIIPPIVSEGRCSISINTGQSKLAYATPQAVNAGAAQATISEGRYLAVFGRWGMNNNIVQVRYQGQYLWIDSSSGVSQAGGDCSRLSLIPEANPASYCVPAVGESCIDIYSDSPQVILAHVLYAEANSFGAAGMANVAQVIRNNQAYSGRSNILSVVLAEDPSVNSNHRYTYVGLAEPANRNTPLWSEAMILAQQLLNGSNLTPSAASAVQQNNVLFYCATDLTTARNAPKVHIDELPDFNIGQIYRTVDQGACQ